MEEEEQGQQLEGAAAAAAGERSARTTTDERRRQFKRGHVAREEATNRRRHHTAEVRKATRDRAITAKRFKWDAPPPLDPSSGAPDRSQPVPPLGALSEAALAEVVGQLQAPLPAQRYAALHQLRRLLASADPPLDAIVQLGAVPLLIRFLGEAEPDNQLAAAWCLTNIAAGSHEQTQAALKAAPFLINLLSSANPALEEQAAWAIANIAGDSVECRDVLRAQGALPPMVHLLNSKAQQWNELKMVLVEVLWLLSYITAYGEPFLRQLMDNRIEICLVGLLDIIHSNRDGNEKNAAPEFILPLLRVFGNFISRSNLYTDILISRPPFLPFLARCLTSETRPVRKEATWVISNLAGGTPAHIQALLQSGLGDIVVQTFKTQPFDIKKEAGFALMNIATEKQHLIKLVSSGVLTDFVALLSVPDLEAVMMGLDFLEMVLRHHPEGELLVEESDGLEAIENLQYTQNEAIASKAAYLVQKYFGEFLDSGEA